MMLSEGYGKDNCMSLQCGGKKKVKKLKKKIFFGYH